MELENFQFFFFNFYEGERWRASGNWWIVHVIYNGSGPLTSEFEFCMAPFFVALNIWGDNLGSKKWWSRKFSFQDFFSPTCFFFCN